ncbi:ATP-binding protein [Thermohalobacter berrensis]|uniref:Anti-sigma regulatory factor n=1 Tax=Thermohalobacter berrensis TaxID=99594 RepID=A0A419T6X7_9FIRM|nr:anti-sigma regulatory factor [Thermohalobacter berrensis]RKD33185.1 anti-sigma regulatory factor [Thermohalobacter berrensis]
MNKKDDTIKLEYDIIQNDFVRAGEASSNVKKILKQLGIDSKIIRRVAIVTYEAEMNIVIHSYGGKLLVEISSKKIEITAKDNGPGIEDIEKAMQEGFSTASNEIRELGFGAGMGLPNMKKCSDVLKIDSEKGKGTTVYMEIFMKSNQN